LEFTQLEKNLILRRCANNINNFVIEKFGKKGEEDYFELVFSAISYDDWEKLKDIESKVIAYFVRKKWELARFLCKEPGEEPPAIDVRNIEPRVLQLAMFLYWRYISPTKDDDETELEFERRKDQHDFFLGYVNHELIENPLFKVEQFNMEHAKQNEIANASLRTLMRFYDR